MSDVWTEIMSVRWWLSVVVATVVLNVLSAYLKPWLDGRLALISARRRASTEKASKARANRIKLLQQDSLALKFAHAAEFRSRLRALSYYVMGLLLLLLGQGTPLNDRSEIIGTAAHLLSLLFVSLGLLEHFLAMRYRDLLHEAIGLKFDL